MAFESFEELTANRRKWIEASRENGFESGIRRLLTDLYPDKAHFLYELLQNAEDAEATRVEFRLEDNALIFVHDGKRLFNLKDVESITSIADSTKRNDGGSIGKFGIGFKAVFSYTLMPIVHSGAWHFKICNTVVPEKTDEDINHRFAGAGKTFFKFPFNNPQKPAAKAYQEIAEGLSSLAPETILFLKNIREVYVSFGSHESFVTKTENGNMTVLQRLEDSGKSVESRYLKFEKTVETFTLEDGSNSGPLTIGIAYRLRQKEGLREPVSECPSERYAIVPTTNRNVFVFFPAEKETSGLRFCIHAPFASTAARDSVRDTNDNRRIVFLLVELLAESLFRLKDEGFLSTEFLGILPNSKDKVADLYSGFHDRAIWLFRDEPLMPTRSGGYAPAADLFRGSAAMSGVISDEDLAEFHGEGSKWVKNAKMIHSPADCFLSDLEIPEYDIEQLVDDLETTDAQQVRQMMSRKTIDQLASLYSQLSEYLDCHKDESLRAIPIIRLSTGEMECADAGIFTGEPLQEVGDIQGCKFVDPEIYGDNRQSRQRDEILRFFRDLGIEECNETSMMKSFIDRFWKDKEKRRLSDVEWSAYLARLVKLLEAKKIDEEIAKRFPVRSQRGQYIEISKAYIDDPYLKTGLSCLEDALASAGFHLLDSLYEKRLSKNVLEKFRLMLNELGVHSQLWLVESPICKNPHYFDSLVDWSRRTNRHERKLDYDIPGLSKVRNGMRMREPQARLVWELLLSVEPEELRATYSANMSDPGRTAPATYICTLTDSSWIPCKDGTQCKPCDACFDDLPDGWTIPKPRYDHPSLAAIKFGQATRLRREAQEKEDETLRRLGISGGAEEVRQLKELLCEMKKHGMTLEQIKEKMMGQKRTESVSARDLPKEAARNVSARMECVTRNFASAPRQQYVMVGRSVHVANSRIREDARAYLRAKYESDGKMFCQLCQKAAPFRARDGHGYFEATQVFARMHRDVTEQFVSLCPQCRAKYDEWIRRSVERARSFKRSIIAHQPKQGEESVRIPLPGEAENDVKNPLSGETLYFTGTHFVDLRQAVLEDERLGRLDDSTESGNEADVQENVMGFVDWYLSYDKTGKLALAQISNALAHIKECRQQYKKGGVVMWETCMGRYIKKVMSFWPDYHARFPSGESEPEAQLSVERHSREIT